MSFTQVLWQEQHRIIPISSIAITYGIRDTWKRCRALQNKPQEPDFVAGLVLESTPIIYDAFRAIFGKYGIRFSLISVYCHQTPKVRYSGIQGTCCEVGDLLIVHVHKESGGRIIRNALLYQAKMSSAQPHPVSNSETDQLRLYTEWPEFEYHQSPPLSGQRRDVDPKFPHTGAQYMLIDDRPPNHPDSGLLGIDGTYPIGSCMADKYLYDHNDLASELFDFLLLRSGMTFVDMQVNAPMDGWSQLVWDLLSTSIKKAFNRRNSGRINAPRYGGDPSEELDSYWFAQSSSPVPPSTAVMILGQRHAKMLMNQDCVPPNDNDPPRDEDRNSKDRGVSLILFETSEGPEL